MKITLPIIVLAVSAVLLPRDLHAQILWGDPTNYTGDAATDISILGTFVGAQDSNGSVDVTGVGDTTFDSTIPGVSISGIGPFGGSDGSGSSATPYLEALNGCAYVNVTPQGNPDGVSQVATISFNGLTAGDVYQVQVWNVVGGGAHETLLSGVNTADLNGSLFVLGTFTADVSGTESFTFQGVPGGYYGEVNAVALRNITDVPEPTTYAMLFAGLGALVLVARLRRTA